MAKTFSIKEAGAPQNVVARLCGIAGGVLTASTTYYYKIVGIGYNDYYYNSTFQTWLSLPSAETSVTTDTTHKKVFIECDILKDLTSTYEVQAFTVYRSKTSGNYKQTNASGAQVLQSPQMENGNITSWNRVNVVTLTQYRRYTVTMSNSNSLTIGETVTLSSGGTGIVVSGSGTTFNIYTKAGTWTAGASVTGSVTGALTGTFSSVSAYNGFVMVDSIASDSANIYTQPMPTNGLPNIVIGGGTSGDPITPQNIYEYLVDVSRTELIDVLSAYDAGDATTANGKNPITSFKFKFNMQDLDVNNYFKIQGGTSVYWAQVKYALTGNSQRGELDANGTTTNGACEIANMQPGWYPTCYVGNHKFYGSSMIGPTATVAYTNSLAAAGFSTQWTGFPIMQDSTLKFIGRFNAQYQVKNSRLMVSGEAGDPTNGKGGVTSTLNVNFDGPIQMYYVQSETSFKNFLMNNAGNPRTITSDAYYTSTACKTFHWIDSTLIAGSTLLGNYRGASGGVGSDHVFLEKNTLNLKMIDSTGNPISGATITIKDANGANALFSTDWDAYTVTVLGRTGTSVTLLSGTFTVGKYYKSGDEIIYVSANTSGSTYTIARAQLGTTANNIGAVGDTNGMNYFYQMLDSVSTDASGLASVLLNNRYWKVINNTNTSFVDIAIGDLLARGPFTITISKAGYETYTMVYSADTKRTETIEMKTAVPVMSTTSSQVAVKVNPANSGANRDKVVVV